MKIHALFHANEKSTFWVLVFLAAILVGMYVYSLKMVMFNVVARGNSEKSISGLNSSITELESRYIGLKNNINIELAYSLGYKEVEKTTFVQRKAVSAASALSSAP